VVGAALRPVEQLRAGAEAITGAEAGGGGAGGEAAGGAGSEAGGGAGAGRLPVPEPRDEIHRLATTLNDMLDRLAAARDRQRVFVADAAHELRSPIASIRTQLEVAQRLGDIDPQLAADLLADADRLYRLVADLLLLARADEGAPVAPPRPVELGGLLRDVARRYAGGRLPVTVVPAPPAWTRGDPGGLDRVLTNLVDNAVRHAVGRVELAVAVDGGFHLVTVVDDGPGVPDADRERVFDRFTRLDDARARDSGGAGLGLAIVAELVRRHGGSVRLADAGPGLRVELRLPATDGDEPA
jgi:signal transduction histidine kinase